MSTPSVTIGICTRNRVSDLARAIESVVGTGQSDYELIISDDSTTDATKTMMRNRYPHLLVLSGPCRGLSANRNSIIERARGKYILFLDDDACLAGDFLPIVRAALEEAGPNVIVTGSEINNGVIVAPNDQDYLGFQRKPYVGRKTNTIVINSTVFPTLLFRDIRFDEAIVYGYDEVDIATRARTRGYTIMHIPEAANFHYPSKANRDYYAPHVSSSRIYVTFKRYFLSNKSRSKAFVYLIVAFAHLIAGGLRRGGLGSVPGLVECVKATARRISNLRNAPRVAL